MAEHGDLEVPIIDADADEQAENPAQHRIQEEREHGRSLTDSRALRQRCMFRGPTEFVYPTACKSLAKHPASISVLSGPGLILEPGDRRGDGIRQRRSAPAEGSLELAAIDHPGSLGLIELLLHRTQGGIEQGSQRDPPPGRRPQAGRVTGRLEDHLDEPAHGDRLGVGDVPHLSLGLLPLPQGDQRPGEVLDEGHGVGNIGVAQHLGGLPLDRSGEDPAPARSISDDPWCEEVLDNGVVQAFKLGLNAAGEIILVIERRRLNVSGE